MTRLMVLWLLAITACWGLQTPQKDFLGWPELSRFEGGAIPESLQKFQDQKVSVMGFIVPLVDDGDFERIKEFLLVPFPLACIHVPPPPPNQIVYVKMKKAIPLNIDLTGVKISGVLRIRLTDEAGYLYEMVGDSAVKGSIKIEDPFLEILKDIESQST